jgi:hypothetical protein
MQGLLLIVLIFVAYIVVTRFVLPRFGIST